MRDTDDYSSWKYQANRFKRFPCNFIIDQTFKKVNIQRLQSQKTLYTQATAWGLQGVGKRLVHIRMSTERQLRADIKVEGGGILWSTSSVYLFLYT